MFTSINFFLFVVYSMDNFVEQRICLKFSSNRWKCWKKPLGALLYRKPEYGVWYKDFKNCCRVVEDLLRSGIPWTTNTEENVEKVKEIVLENRYVSLKELSSELNLVYGIDQNIVVDILGMRRVEARLVPKDLQWKTPSEDDCWRLHIWSEKWFDRHEIDKTWVY